MHASVHAVLVRGEGQGVLRRPGQERHGFTVYPAEEARPVVGRERVPALAAGQLEVALRLVARGDGEALGAAEVPVLHPWHVVITGELDGRHVEEPLEPRERPRERMADARDVARPPGAAGELGTQEAELT